MNQSSFGYWWNDCYATSGRKWIRRAGPFLQGGIEMLIKVPQKAGENTRLPGYSASLAEKFHRSTLNG